MPRVKTENVETIKNPSPATKKARRLEDLSGPELAERYNQAADQLERKHVKKFKSRAEGIKKVQEIEAELKPKGQRGPIEDPFKSSGAYIRELILEGGRTRQEIVDMVLERFPDHKTTTSDVSWNRWKMRKDGHEVPAFVRQVPAKKAQETEEAQEEAEESQEEALEGVEA